MKYFSAILSNLSCGRATQFPKVPRIGRFIGLTAILSVGFAINSNERAFAANPSCNGEDCNDRNPVEYRCNTDASVVEQVSPIVYRWQDAGQPQQIIIQQIYSESCDANWVRAYIPDNTFLYIQERELVNGGQPIRGLFQAEGTGYFWADGNMSNGHVTNQACIALPFFANDNGYDLYDRYCTDFSEK